MSLGMMKDTGNDAPILAYVTKERLVILACQWVNPIVTAVEMNGYMVFLTEIY